MTIDYAELIERLRVMQSEGLFRSIGMDCYVEPKEAITALEEQAARIAELEGALRQIVGHCDNSGYGNPIVNERIVDRCDETARQALTKGSDHEGRTAADLVAEAKALRRNDSEDTTDGQ